MPRPSVAPCLLTALLTSTGCISTSTETRRLPIEVRTEPAGAAVVQRDGRGVRGLGRAPLTADVEYEATTYDFDERSWLFTALTGAGTAAAIGWWTQVDSSTSSVLGPVLTTSMVGTLFAVALGLSAWGQSVDGDEVSRRYVGGAPPTLSAELDGHVTASQVLPFDPTAAPERLALTLPATAAPKPAILGVIGDLRPSRTVVAVLDVDDRAGQHAPEVLDQLTEYLSSRIAETPRYAVVPRPQLKTALRDEKKASYSDCVDEACQITLGKAVAAEKIIAPRLLRIGEECALSATLLDLETEATEGAKTIRTACETSSLLDAADALATDLTAR